MKHTELRQFLRCANAENLSPIEKDVFQYYFSRAAAPGEWFCPDAEVAEDIFRSRSGVAEARLKLIEKLWIKENGKFNISILKTFVGNPTKQTENLVGNPTNELNLVGNATKPEDSCRKPDKTDEILVGNATNEPDFVGNATNLVGNPTKQTENLVGNPTTYNDKRNFKEDIKRNKEVEAEGARVRAAAALPKSSEILLPDEFDPLEAFGIIFPNYTPTPFQKQMIANHIRDGTIWRQALFFWAGNNHKAQSVEKLVDKYKKLVKEQEESVKNAVIQPNQPKFKSAAEKRDERAVGEYQYIEKLRADNEQRRLEKLRENNARGS